MALNTKPVLEFETFLNSEEKKLRTIKDAKPRYVKLLSDENPYGESNLLKNMSENIFLMSDLHIGDPIDNWEDKRNKIIETVNATVKPDDHLLILGDLSPHYNTGDIWNVAATFNVINCNNLYLILGNNDQESIETYINMGFKTVTDKFIWKNIVFSHMPINILPNQINIHGHMHEEIQYINVDWHNHINIWDKDFKPIRLREVLDRYKSGYYQGITINDGEELEIHKTEKYFNEVNESAIKETHLPFKLYHASKNLFDELRPFGIDLGNKFQEIGWSLFTWINYSSAMGWGCWEVFRHLKEIDDNIILNGCINSQSTVLTQSVYDYFKENINKYSKEDLTFYVYTIPTKNNYEYGLGHSSNTPNCVTIRTDHIKYSKVDKVIMTIDMVNKYCKVVPDGYEPTQKEYGKNKRLLSFLMTHDFMYQPRLRRQISKAIDNGDLQIGDDISKYLKDNNIDIVTVSFKQRLGDIITESVIDNRLVLDSEYLEDDDYCFNLNLWDYNDNNILYITGLSGSGKTTLATDMAKNYKCYRVELDYLIAYYMKRAIEKNRRPKFIQYIKQECPIVIEFFNTHDYELYDSWGDGLHVTKDFFDWFIPKVSGDGNLYIVNGAQIPEIFDAEYFATKPIIVKKGDLFKSLERRTAREQYGLKKSIEYYIKFLFKVSYHQAHIKMKKYARDISNVASVSEYTNVDLNEFEWHYIEMKNKINGNPREKDEWVEESSRQNIYYRVSYDGIGIYEALRNNVSKDEWITILKSDKINWLPKPPKYDENYRSYFTIKGFKIFKAKTLPIMHKYLDKSKILITTESLDVQNIVYQDEYQVVVQSIVTETTKSTIDKDFKPKGKKNLSSFKKVHITQSIIDKYKREYPYLKNVRCKDTKEYICDGYMWLDGNELVATVGSCEYRDDKTKWIVSLEIMKEYRGYGLSKQILDYAVNDMNCKYLSVNKNNEVAKRLYDKYGFKVYEESDSMYYMSVTESYNILEENLLFNSKDLYHNIDKFESGEANVLLVTGFSGSGKSTLAKQLAIQYKCKHFELDCLEFFDTIDKKELAKEEPGLYEFLETHQYTKNRLMNKEVKTGKEFIEIYETYIKFLVNWCKKRKHERFIIEGLQIYEVFNNKNPQSFIISNPIIIKGTSGVVSSIRGAKRNSKEEGRPFMNEFSGLLAWVINDNKQLNKFKETLTTNSTISI